LVNLGLLVAKLHGCTHVAVNNLNLNITEEMIPYYFSFKEADKGVVNLGFKWNDYYQKKFLMDICLWNLDTLLKIGGYPNQIWGWGCSDRILYHRYFKYLKENKKDGGLYIPIFKNQPKRYDLIEWGQVIDPQYQHLKILADWNLSKYDDIEILNKYLGDIADATNRKGSKCNDTEHSHSHSHFHENDKYENDAESSGTYKKYKSYLKVLDKHQHQKETEHYTFKLITKLQRDIIE
jgi:hypothetical protein